jgi:hypothetical protein
MRCRMWYLPVTTEILPKQRRMGINWRNLNREVKLALLMTHGNI